MSAATTEPEEPMRSASHRAIEPAPAPSSKQRHPTWTPIFSRNSLQVCSSKTSSKACNRSSSASCAEPFRIQCAAFSVIEPSTRNVAPPTRAAHDASTYKRSPEPRKPIVPVICNCAYNTRLEQRHGEAADEGRPIFPSVSCLPEGNVPSAPSRSWAASPELEGHHKAVEPIILNKIGVGQ